MIFLRYISLRKKLFLIIILSSFFLITLGAFYLWKLKYVAHKTEELNLFSKEMIKSLRETFRINSEIEDIYNLLTIYVKSGDQQTENSLDNKVKILSNELNEYYKNDIKRLLDSLAVLKIRMSTVRNSRENIYKAQDKFYKNLARLSSNCETVSCKEIVNKILETHANIEKKIQNVVLNSKGQYLITEDVDNAVKILEENSKVLTKKERTLVRALINSYYDLDDAITNIVSVQNKSHQSQEKFLASLNNLSSLVNKNTDLTKTEKLVKSVKTSVMNTSKISAAFMIISLFLLILMGIIIAKDIENHLKEIVDKVNIMAQGNFRESVIVGGKDEISFLSKNIEKFRTTFGQLVKSVKNYIRDMENLSKRLEKFTEKNMKNVEKSVKIATETEDETKKLNMSMADTVDIIKGLVKEAEGALNNIILSNKELVDQLLENSINSQKKILNLNEEIKNIEKIADFIHKIAEETNLLALNATIEAARAGEAGRGFSVVANEIKELANQTANSTEKISKIINQIIKFVKSSVENIDKNVSLTKQIHETSEKLTEVINKQINDYYQINIKIDEAAKKSEKFLHVLQNLQQIILTNLEEEKMIATETLSLKKKADSMKQVIQKIKV